jgi:hypothetical protein
MAAMKFISVAVEYFYGLNGQAFKMLGLPGFFANC